MSLKAFHVLFITASCALAFGFGVWMLRDYRSPDEVVFEGLRLLQQQDERWNAEARGKIDEGWNQARAGQLRSPEVIRENLLRIVLPGFIRRIECML